MKAKELIKYLKLNPELEVGFTYTVLECSGHNPDNENDRCYCPYVSKYQPILYLVVDDHDEEGRLMLNKRVTMHSAI